MRRQISNKISASDKLEKTPLHLDCTILECHAGKYAGPVTIFERILHGDTEQATDCKFVGELGRQQGY